jgi:hypothetical protein
MSYSPVDYPGTTRKQCALFCTMTVCVGGHNLGMDPSPYGGLEIGDHWKLKQGWLAWDFVTGNAVFDTLC